MLLLFLPLVYEVWIEADARIIHEHMAIYLTDVHIRDWPVKILWTAASRCRGMPTSLAKWFNVPIGRTPMAACGSAPRGPGLEKSPRARGKFESRHRARPPVSLRSRDSPRLPPDAAPASRARLRKVPGATGRNPAGALKQACAKIGVRGAACDVAIGAHQPQTDRDVGNGIMPDLLERGIQ